MSLTLSQAFERTKDLSGEIKAAQEMVRVTEQEAIAAEHTASLARQANDKARAALEEKLAERASLAERMSELTLQIGEAKAAEPEPYPEFTSSPLYTNGAEQAAIERLNRVFGEATQP